MSREVVATPLFTRRLKGFLDEYAELGAVRFVERLQQSYQGKVENISAFDEIAPARRRSVQGKRITVREYVLDAGARNFLVLFWVLTPEQTRSYLPQDGYEQKRTSSYRTGQVLKRDFIHR